MTIKREKNTVNRNLECHHIDMPVSLPKPRKMSMDMVRLVNQLSD
jgi:hypothetical protein